MKKEELETIDHDKVLLVDIREHYELEEVPKLPKAVNIPLGEIVKEAEDATLPKNKKIVTICRSGGRCQIANETLKNFGYDVDYLEGGMSAL